MSPNGNYFSFHSYNHSSHPNIKKNDKKENRCVVYTIHPHVSNMSAREFGK